MGGDPGHRKANSSKPSIKYLNPGRYPPQMYGEHSIK
jgi:hypothetical protein